jgi:hypothetical protein
MKTGLSKQTRYELFRVEYDPLCLTRSERHGNVIYGLALCAVPDNSLLSGLVAALKIPALTTHSLV